MLAMGGCAALMITTGIITSEWVLRGTGTTDCGFPASGPRLAPDGMRLTASYGRVPDLGKEKASVH